MAFIALQQMDVAGGRQVKPGDLVPEAETWENVALWMRQGYVANVADADVSTFLEGLATGQDVSHLAPSIAHFYLGAASEALRAQAALSAVAPAIDAIEEKPALLSKPLKSARR